MSSFVLEIFRFFCCADQEGNGVIDRSTEELIAESGVSLRVLGRCSSDLAPWMYVTKGTK